MIDPAKVIDADDTAVTEVAALLAAAALCRELLGAVEIDTPARSHPSRRPAGIHHSSRHASVSDAS